MTTRKVAHPVHELAGEGTFAPIGLDAPMTKTQVRATLAAFNQPKDLIDDAVSQHTDGDPFPGHLFGLTAANPGGIGNGSKLLLLDYLFGATAPAAAAATYYMGLVTGTYTGGTSDINLLQGVFTSNPEITTANWTNYARAAVANNPTNFPAASAVPGTQVANKNNGAQITFTANATVTGTGPTPTGWFLTTLASGAPTAAQMVLTGNITSGSVPVVNGANVYVPPSSLPVSLT